MPTQAKGKIWQRWPIVVWPLINACAWTSLPAPIVTCGPMIA
ncbi:MAG: hypothetical protein BWX70_02840 [Verrucomicrobia bacterium ADurb.Bin070]|nr:MAG: hypothetical protein BWX70_02840 [Verrucomicrobia bacterium ADurb.Bin070]